MRILIIGGGKVGGYVARQLIGSGHTVTVTEADPQIAERLAETLHAVVLEGDGTSIDILEAAEVERADWVLAVTGRDEENLVACELAQTLGASRTLARLNDPRNRPTFDALGIPVVAVTDLIGEVIEREVDVVELQRLAILGRGQISLIEVQIPEGISPQAVIDLNLPSQTVLVAVWRAGQLMIPKGETVIEPGDRVTAVTAVDQEPEVRWALCGADEGPDRA